MEKSLLGVKVAILVANGFEQVEMEKPRKALEEEGATTFLISPEKGSVRGWNHSEKGNNFSVDVPLNEANANDYDALLLPGGVMNPDHLRLLPEAVAFVKAMKDKPIAAICHAPWLLINAQVARGKKLTSWLSLKDDLINAGADWIDEPVVRDGHLITSRKPDDIPQFNKAMIELFSAR